MKYKTVITRERPGVDGSEEEVPITVEATYQRASGDGWNEPHELAYWLIEDADGPFGEIELTASEMQDIATELEERRQERRL